MKGFIFNQCTDAANMICERLRVHASQSIFCHAGSILRSCAHTCNTTEDSVSLGMCAHHLPETGRRSVSESRKAPGGDKGPPQTGRSGAWAVTPVNTVSL